MYFFCIDSNFALWGCSVLLLFYAVMLWGKSLIKKVILADYVTDMVIVEKRDLSELSKELLSRMDKSCSVAICSNYRPFYY